MFQYEYEKRPPSSSSCDSRATMTTDWSRVYPNSSRSYPSAARTYPSANVCPTVDRARPPLPPRPIVCERLPTKTAVPLKVWIIASASCFAVCAALVLATVAITKWGTVGGEYHAEREVYQVPEPIYALQRPAQKTPKTLQTTTELAENDISIASDEDIKFPILEKLSIFKNIVANRDKNKRVEVNKEDKLSLINKPQLHPLHDITLHHVERKIEKKDQAIYPIHLNLDDHKLNKNKPVIPIFKPTLPDIDRQIQIMDARRKSETNDYEEYYNDDNLYDDYMQSNSMTSYLIEKIQELHDWITSDPDFVAPNATKKQIVGNQFGQVLKALNDSLIEGNVTIIMNKLKDIYFGDNYTHANHTRKVILSNSTDLLSFGILTLDVMLLHNIQLMAWENQETARNKMMKDPDVFAFNALFLEPTKVEARQTEVQHHEGNALKRPNLRMDSIDELDFGKSLLENVLEVGMSTARAAIHLGRAYKNTKIVLSQLSNANRETLNANIQNQISRNIDANTHALHHLQSSFSNSSGDNLSFTELDCVWLLYCKNLMVTAKLNAPYGTMARINGLALRMLTGELSADRALDTMLYEALTGWSELRCSDMFPRCSKVDPATVVMESILAPVRKSQGLTRP